MFKVGWHILYTQHLLQGMKQMQWMWTKIIKRSDSMLGQNLPQKHTTQQKRRLFLQVTFHTLITTSFPSRRFSLFPTFCPLKKLPTLFKHTSLFKCLPAFLLSSPPKPNKNPHTLLLRGRAASLFLIRPHYFTLFFRLDAKLTLTAQ